jgi:predicted PurR-regulated permease PerM
MPKESDKVSFGKMRSVFFFGLIAILSIGVLYLFAPFAYPIFWAAVVAIMFYPVHQRLVKFFKKESPAALVSVLLIFLIIFIPITTLSTVLVKQAHDLYVTVSNSNLIQNPEQVQNWLSTNELTAPLVNKIQTDWTGYAANAIQWISNFLLTSIKSITQNSLNFLLMTFIMFYSLYYFFKDGPRMLHKIMRLSPLGDEYEQLLYERFTSTTRATLKSTLIVGGIQGLMSGILFWVTGIEGAFIWGVIMTIIAIIPAIGTPIILIPAGIVMLLLGNFWQGLVLLIGGGVISTLDNLIRPPLVGKDIQMHPLIVFFATLGGIVMFGISGFVIGPIIAALYISVMSIYEHYYKKELKNN